SRPGNQALIKWADARGVALCFSRASDHATPENRVDSGINRPATDSAEWLSQLLYTRPIAGFKPEKQVQSRLPLRENNVNHEVLFHQAGNRGFWRRPGAAVRLRPKRILAGLRRGHRQLPLR